MYEEDKTKDRLRHQPSSVIRITRFVTADITFIFRKFEGYTPNGLGARSIPVERLSDKNLASGF